MRGPTEGWTCSDQMRPERSSNCCVLRSRARMPTNFALVALAAGQVAQAVVTSHAMTPIRLSAFPALRHRVSVMPVLQMSSEEEDRLVAEEMARRAAVGNGQQGGGGGSGGPGGFVSSRGGNQMSGGYGGQQQGGFGGQQQGYGQQGYGQQGGFNQQQGGMQNGYVDSYGNWQPYDQGGYGQGNEMQELFLPLGAAFLLSAATFSALGGGSSEPWGMSRGGSGVSSSSRMSATRIADMTDEQKAAAKARKDFAKEALNKAKAAEEKAVADAAAAQKKVSDAKAAAKAAEEKAAIAKRTVRDATNEANKAARSAP